jgi:hypothetical protein
VKPISSGFSFLLIILIIVVPPRSTSGPHPAEDWGPSAVLIAGHLAARPIGVTARNVSADRYPDARVDHRVVCTRSGSVDHRRSLVE